MKTICLTYTHTHIHTYKPTQAQVLGLSESVGDALATGCVEYAVSGAVIFCLLVSAWLCLAGLLAKGIWSRRAVFEQDPLNLFQWL